MNDLDRALHDTLTWAADDMVHVENLVGSARTAGLRYRRRRRVATACAGLTAGVVALAVTMSVLPGGDRAAPVTPAASVPASASAARPVAFTTWPVPPAAAGATTAAASPDAVGQPLLLHLSLARIPFDLVGVQYQQLIGERQENLLVTGHDRLVSVRLAPTTTNFDPLDGATQTVDVAGRPGTFAKRPAEDGPSGMLQWRTANGLWLQIHGAYDVADALALAATVRIDRTFRCVVPYRFGSLPAGMTPTVCSMIVSPADRWATILGVSNGTFGLSVFTGREGMGPPNGQLGGRPAREHEGPGDGGTPTLDLGVDRGDSDYVDVSATGRYDKDTVRQVVSGLVWSDGDDPATWPTDPFAR